MNVTLKIKRGEVYKTYTAAAGDNSTVAGLLDQINMTEEDPVEWECSCRQGMCGACAMRINHRPALACNSFVRDLGSVITLEPLSKFPLIRDLKVDRSILQKMIQEMKAYPAENAAADSREAERQYLSASCLMCGCCLEVCPGFTGAGLFGSAFLMHAVYKTVSQETDRDRKRELTRKYRKTQYTGCTGSLACAEVCPLKLPQASSFSRMNQKMLYGV